MAQVKPSPRNTVKIATNGIFIGRKNRFTKITIDEMLAQKENIYSFHFICKPDFELFQLAVKIINEGVNTFIRFSGDYSEDDIDWSLMEDIKGLVLTLDELKELKQIQRLKKLEALYLRPENPSSLSLKVLEGMENLKILHTNISKDLEAIISLPKLWKLCLFDINVDNLEFLPAGNQLQSLIMVNMNINDMSGLIRPKALNILLLNDINAFDDKWANTLISQLSCLERLFLSHLPLITKLHFMSALKNLERLNLHKMENIESYACLSQNSSIKYFTTTTIPEYENPLTGLEHIETVEFDDFCNDDVADNLVKNFKGKNFKIDYKWIRGSKPEMT